MATEKVVVTRGASTATSVIPVDEEAVIIALQTVTPLSEAVDL